MLELKSISPEAIPAALAKAERYRLLHQPKEAESICRDVLRLELGHQQGLVALILALTDQFGMTLGAHLDQARQLLPQLVEPYERAYYEGVILERWGKSQLPRGVPRYAVDDWLRKAMSCYERAEAIRPPRNDDTILRWNSCCRMLLEGIGADAGASRQPRADTEPEADDEAPLI